MAAMSAAIAMVGSAAPATTRLSSSNCAFGASSVRQLPSTSLLDVLSPAASFHSSKAVRASQSSNEERRPRVMVALVAAGAALALNLTPVSPAHAELFGSDTVKVERGATAPDFPGNEATPLGEGSGQNAGSGIKVPEVVRRKVEGVKEMAENAKSTVNGGVPDAATATSEVVRSEGARNVRDAAAEVAKNAAQSVVTNSAQDVVDGVTSRVGNPLEVLMSKITGK